MSAGRFALIGGLTAALLLMFGAVVVSYRYVNQPTPSLSIAHHSLTQVHGYSAFSFDSARTVNMAKASQTAADRAIARFVDIEVSQALQDEPAGKSSTDCSKTSSRCGFFKQQLQEQSCSDEYFCLTQPVEWLPYRANDGHASVSTLVIDKATGNRVRLTDVVHADLQPDFLRKVRQDVATQLGSAGTRAKDTPSDISIEDITSWLPLPGGIDVWFAKFAVAPGALGVIRVHVPFAYV